MTHWAKIKRCCNAHCYMGSEEQPCWGDVEVVDEIVDGDGGTWIHACEGHAHVDWMGAEWSHYTPAPPGCDTIRVKDEPPREAAGFSRKNP